MNLEKCPFETVIKSVHQVVIISINDIDDVEKYKVSRSILNDIIVWMSKDGKFAIECYHPNIYDLCVINQLSGKIYSFEINIADYTNERKDRRLFYDLLKITNKVKWEICNRSEFRLMIWNAIGLMSGVKKLDVYDSMCNCIGDEWNYLIDRVGMMKLKTLSLGLTFPDDEKVCNAIFSSDGLERLELNGLTKISYFIDRFKNENKSVKTLVMKKLSEDEIVYIARSLLGLLESSIDKNPLTRFIVLRKPIVYIGHDVMINVDEFKNEIEARVKLIPGVTVKWHSGIDCEFNLKKIK